MRDFSRASKAHWSPADVRQLLPVSLDCNKGVFFTAEGTHCVCQTHGATCMPLTGKCIFGPCQGQSLKIEVTESEVWLMP